MILYRKILKLNTWKFSKKVYLKLVPAIVITLAVGLVLTHFYATTGWIHLFVKAISVATVFAISFFVFGLSKDEKTKIYNKIKNKLIRKKAN